MPKYLLSLSAIIITAFCAIYIFSIVRKVSYQPEARREMRDLFRRASIGDSQARVRQIFGAGRYQTLTLRTIGPSQWMVSSPPEFGAKNWAFYIEYDGRGKVGALGIRTNDSIYQKPRDSAPADKISPTWRQPFPTPGN